MSKKRKQTKGSPKNRKARSRKPAPEPVVVKGAEAPEIDYVWCWFSPDGELKHIFADPRGARTAIETVSESYSVDATYLQDWLRTWNRHGISPLIRWPVA